MESLLNYIWPGLAVWLSWIWVAIWEWILAKRAMEVMWKRADMTTFYSTVTILWIALVESAVIYWLITAFQMLWNPDLWLYKSIWAWLAIWLAWLWVWVWEWTLVAWALWAMDRNPEMKWKIMTYMILFIALVESAAIYWLITSMKIMSSWAADSMLFVWAWLAVWLAWLWVWIWEWELTWKALDNMWKKPSASSYYLTVAILWVALVESAAIYWLVIWFQILWSEALWWYAAIWAWLAIWLAWLWAWLWEWKLIVWALNAMERNPAIKWKIMTFMVLFLALVEVTAIYWLIVALKIMWWWEDNLVYVWAWLAIWVAWLWVWIWRWYLSEKALDVMWQNPKMISYFLTVSILWVALVESAAIYWLIVAFQLIWNLALSWIAAIAAWSAIWFTWAWAWIWEWLLIKWALTSMNQNPEMKWKYMAFMILFVALVESSAIYWLIIAFKVMW